ncbi:MAG: glycerate kinase [Desulfosalsimonadaceae bacterium]
MHMRSEIIEIFNKAVGAVRPENVFPDLVSLTGDILRVGERSYPISKKDGIHVFGSGKAAAGSAKVMECILGDRLSGGVVVSNVNDPSLKTIKVCVGAHPVADEQSIDATNRLIFEISRLTKDDFFIYLLSGGTSALLERPFPPLTLSDLQNVTKLLLAAGAPIEEMNAVRKHLSEVKGGRLGRMTEAGGVVLVMSDVIGDDLDTIGSAPLYRDRTTFQDVAEILEIYGLWDRLPASVAGLVRKGMSGTVPDTPKTPNPRIGHFLAASNIKALEKARQTALSYGIPAHIMTSRLHGEAREAAKAIAALGREIMASGNPFSPPVCLLFGGETTVTLRGDGRGGRNQELCLAVVKEMAGPGGWVFLSAGTDGIDGNSDAAGAVVDASTLQKAREQGLNPDDYLARNDSNGFFKQTGDLVITGPTGTNVMDLAILYISANT